MTMHRAIHKRARLGVRRSGFVEGLLAAGERRLLEAIRAEPKKKKPPKNPCEGAGALAGRDHVDGDSAPAEGSEPDTTRSQIVGHAAVFDAETEIFPGFHEVVRRGAFTKAIIESDVRGLFNHDPNFVLGRNRAGTLHLEEDEIGLRYEIDVDTENVTVRDLVVKPIERGEVSGSSFAFRPIKEAETIREDDTILRELLEVQLFDVSPVVYPAYDATDAQIRAWMSSPAAGNPEPLVGILRGAGLTDLEIRATLCLAIDDVKASEPTEDGHSAQHDIDLMSRALELEELSAA